MVKVKRKSPETCPGSRSKLSPTVRDILCGYVSPNKQVFNWLRKSVIVCCDRTDCGSLFHIVGEAIAKHRLTMAILG